MSAPGDREWMARALRLARRGLRGTHPNPRVGCVIARDGRIVGEGWHERAGGPHAELAALEAAGDAARDADCFVTLEPCSHHGRTPPCSDALVKAGVARVVAAMADPDPRVAGKGLDRLRAAGVEVTVGLLEAEARELNRGFVCRHERGSPWVRVKLAASLDGRTALASGASRWITGEAARADVQRLRARSSAILTGIGTVLADDPRLNVRIDTPRQPGRVILDPACETPHDARIFDEGGPVTLICAEGASIPEALAGRCDIQQAPLAEDGLDLNAVLRRLAAAELNEIHVEAGPTLAGALMREGLADELVLYLAPSMLGHEGRPLAIIPGIDAMAKRVEWRWHEMRRIGEDLRLILRNSG